MGSRDVWESPQAKLELFSALHATARRQLAADLAGGGDRVPAIGPGSPSPLSMSSTPQSQATTHRWWQDDAEEQLSRMLEKADNLCGQFEEQHESAGLPLHENQIIEVSICRHFAPVYKRERAQGEGHANYHR